MTSYQQILAFVFVLSVHMVCQSSGLIVNTPSEKFDTKLNESDSNFSNQGVESTTIVPEKSYVFSAEDYDALQNETNFKKALSVITYEPQKLKAVKKKIEYLKNDEKSSEKITQNLHTTPLAFTEKHPEILQQTKRIYNPLENESLTNNPLGIKENYGVIEKAGDGVHVAASTNVKKHYISTTIPPSKRNNEEINLTSSPLLLSSRVTESIKRNQTPSENSNNKIHENIHKISKPETKFPSVKKRHRSHENQSSNKPIKEKQFNSLIHNNRVPQPFVETTNNVSNQNHTVQDEPIKQNTANQFRISVEPFYTTNSAINNISLTVSPLDQDNLASSFHKRKDSSAHFPINYDQVLEQPAIPETVPYSTVLFKHNSRHSKKTPKPKKTLVQSYDEISTQPTAHSIPKRISTSPKYDQAEHFTLPLPQKQKNILPISSTRRTKTHSNSNVPRNQESIQYSAKIRQHPHTYSDDVSIDRRQPLPYSTVSSEYEQSDTYETIPKQRNVPQKIRNGYSIPPKTKKVNSNNPRKQEPIEHVQYDKEDVLTPTDISGHRVKVKYNSASPENNNYKESDTDDSYSDDISDKKDINNSNYNNEYNTDRRRPSKSHEHTYKVTEDESENSEEIIQTKIHPVHQQKNYKVDRSYGQDSNQYVDSQSVEESSDYDQPQEQNIQVATEAEYPNHSQAEQSSDYDQSQEQNVQVAAEVEHPNHSQVAYDLTQAADHHQTKHEKPKPKHHKEEKGGEEHEGGHEEKGKKSKKGYKQFHEHEEGEKGHHKKEKHNVEYDEKDGEEKDHSHESKYHEEHEKGDKGEKKFAFDEEGKHQEGHSTKGKHVIHKNDEYEKNVEFYDEFHDSGEEEKEGGHYDEHNYKKGGHFKKGHHHEDHDDKEHGEKGEYEKGHHFHEKKGHKEDEGHKKHHEHKEHYGKKGGHKDGKEWHKKGQH